MRNTDLTEKQQDILDCIKEKILSTGFPPTVREICSSVGLSSPSSVHAHLATLEAKGYIKRNPTQSRAIEIADENFYMTRQEVLQVPFVGRVAAGEPILAEQNIDSYFSISAGELGKHSGNLYMLEVHGDSMVNIGIFDGDRLIVEEAHTARNGEIAVVLVDDGATVKRFFKEDGYYRLQPENDTMEPIIVDHCEVIGKPVSLIRMFRRF